jgi:hypothetical protein
MPPLEITATQPWLNSPARRVTAITGKFSGADHPRRTRNLLLPRLLSGRAELASTSANGASSNQPGATPQVSERKSRQG